MNNHNITTMTPDELRARLADIKDAISDNTLEIIYFERVNGELEDEQWQIEQALAAHPTATEVESSHE